MPTPILATKLYVPPLRQKVVVRPRLIERLNEGLRRPFTLISAPAGFGKTTLVSEWIAQWAAPVLDLEKAAPASERQNQKSEIQNPRFCWLSLDEGDNDPARFLMYLVAALQTAEAGIGQGLMGALQSRQPPPAEAALTALLNESAALPGHSILVLDDYHVIDAKPADAPASVDDALAFLVEHLPPQMHLVITTREDPRLPLARLRARGQLTELRAADLRFTPAEAIEFLNQVMGLNLSAGDVAALETRTEGWIVGLQLAALALQPLSHGAAGRLDAADFIKSFTGSHHFVLDYLIEEVLQQQPESVQTFLLRTSILHRLCGPLCEAVLDEEEKEPGSGGAGGQATLEYLERANLFIVPLDGERRWYRYHHLFADLLRQRLRQSLASAAGGGEQGLAGLHIRASQWYEDNGLEVEAFEHAAAANDVARAERLIESGKMPLHLRSVTTAVLDWLASLPASALDGRPSLRVKSATLSLVNGRTTGVEEKLQAAEAAMAALPGAAAKLNAEPERRLIGQIAAARATLAVTHYQPEAMIAQAHRALEYLPPDDIPFRITAFWTLGFAYQLLGDRASAAQALAEALALSQMTGDNFSIILAASGLAQVQEMENQLHQAAESYQRVLQLHGDHPQPNACEDHLGLARVYYQWNDLEAAERHGLKSLEMARQYDRVIDRYVISEVFLARLKLAQGDMAGAADMVAEADQAVREHHFEQRRAEVADAQVWVLLAQDNLAAAVRLAKAHKLPLCQARVWLAQGDPAAALAIVEPLRQEMEARGWADERLRAMALQAAALHAQGEQAQARQVLGEALRLAEPGGFIRLFVDEGEHMRLAISDFRLWIEKQSRGQDQPQTSYIEKLLAAFPQLAAIPPSKIDNPKSQTVEPLSERELAVLRLVAQGLSNQEIGAQLFLALDTIKGYNRRIYEKLQVQRRTEAIARARELGLL